MLNKKKLTVVLSGFSGTTLAEPGSSIAAALRRRFGDKIHLIALAYHTHANALYTPQLVDEVYLVRPLADVYEHLMELKNVFNRCQADIYIPGLELEVKYLTFGESFLQNVRYWVPKTSIFERITKQNLPHFAHYHNILSPKTHLIWTKSEFDYWIHRHPFPCVIKSIINGAEQVSTLNEAYQSAQGFSVQWAQPILIQEYIVGEQYMVAALCDQDGSHFLLPAKKYLLTTTGKSAITITIEDAELTKIAEYILNKIEWVGPLELEFIRTKTGHWYLFEVNPRFPSWIDVGDAKHNNLPALLIDRLMATTPKYVLKYGCVAVRDTDETFIPLASIQSFQRQHHLNLYATPSVLPTVKIYRPNKSEPSIAVTGVSGYHMTMPGAGLMRAFHRVKAAETYLYLSEHYYDTGCYRSDLFHHVIPIRFDLSSERLLNQLIELNHKKRISAIVPTLERHLLPFATIAPALKSAGIQTCLPTPETIEQALQFPMGLMQIAVPKTYRIRNHTELETALADLGYPVVLKVLGADKACLDILFSATEKYRLYDKIDLHTARTYILQQYIMGEHFSVCGFAKTPGVLGSAVTIKALQSCYYGKIWMATALKGGHAAPMIALLEQIVSALKWQGPIEIDCIRDHHTEQLYCIDLNPRVPSWFSYASACEPTLLSDYLDALDLHTKEVQESCAASVYVRFPRNYTTDTKTLGALLVGKEVTYYA